jgi:hypothetical protein
LGQVGTACMPLYIYIPSKQKLMIPSAVQTYFSLGRIFFNLVYKIII